MREFSANPDDDFVSSEQAEIAEWRQAARVEASLRREFLARAEKAEAERNELYGYVSGLLGLLQLLRGRDDIPDEVKEIMNTNHRAADAAAYLTQIVPPTAV